MSLIIRIAPIHKNKEENKSQSKRWIAFLSLSLSLLSNSLSDSMFHSIFISLSSFLTQYRYLFIYLCLSIQVIVRKAKTDKIVEAGCGMCLTLRKTIKEERRSGRGKCWAINYSWNSSGQSPAIFNSNQFLSLMENC